MGKLALAPGMHMRWFPQGHYGQSERVPMNLPLDFGSDIT
jgi:hypothetical protein